MITNYDSLPGFLVVQQGRGWMAVHKSILLFTAALTRSASSFYYTVKEL